MEGRMVKIPPCWGEKFPEFFPARFGEIYMIAQSFQQRPS
jgi:hypothetical protein